MGCFSAAQEISISITSTNASSMATSLAVVDGLKKTQQFSNGITAKFANRFLKHLQGTKEILKLLYLLRKIWRPL